MGRGRREEGRGSSGEGRGTGGVGRGDWEREEGGREREGERGRGRKSASVTHLRLQPQSTHRVAMATFPGLHTTIMRVKSAQPGVVGGCTPSPFHSIYHHEQRCGVRSS
jgi:hypothetical protein